MQQRLGSAIAAYLQIILPLLAVSIFVLGYWTDNNNVLLISLLTIFISNIFYSLMKFRERIIFALFNCACLFFLFGRNVIELFSGEDWQYRFSHFINKTAVSLIFISLFFLFIGSVIGNRLDIEKPPFKNKNVVDREEFQKSVQLVSLILFFFCAAFLYLCEFDKLMFMQGKEYYQYYAEYTPSVPGIFLSIAALTKFCLCVFLATMPSKRMALVPLAIYCLSTVPMFVIGQRNSLISAVLFVLCYFVIRDYCSKQKEALWVGKKEITAIVIALPFLFAFLSIYESLRYGYIPDSVNILESVTKLFRSQGVTYDVIAKGLESAEIIAQNSRFTFGPVITYLLGNSISMRLFGTTELRSQTVESALSGYNYGDAVSYQYLGDLFTTGAGLGSSYIIETYLDFGVIGLIIFSTILGVFFSLMVRAFGKNTAVSFIILVCLLGLFMVLRARALDPVVLLFYIPMYFVIVFIAVFSALLIKKYFHHSPVKNLIE